MIIKNGKADRSANQSATNEIPFHRDYITAFPFLKETIEIPVDEYENLIRSETKLLLLTDMLDRSENITLGDVSIMLGINRRKY